MYQLQTDAAKTIHKQLFKNPDSILLQNQLSHDNMNDVSSTV